MDQNIFNNNVKQLFTTYEYLFNLHYIATDKVHSGLPVHMQITRLNMYYKQNTIKFTFQFAFALATLCII